MAGKNVVREDIVQVGFEVEEMPFQDIVKDINEMKASLMGAVGDGENSLQDMAKTANQSGKEIVNSINGGNAAMGDFANDTKNMSSEIKKSVSDISSGFDDVTDSSGKAKNSIAGIGPSINSVKASTDDFVKKLKEIASVGIDKIKHPIQTIKTALGSAKEAGAAFVTKLKDIGKQKFSTVTNEFKKIKSTLTEGQSGLKGFTTALKNIGKISVSGATKGLKTIADKAKTGATHLKQLGSTKFNALKSDLSDVASKLKTVESKAKSAVATLGKMTLKGIGVGALASATALTAVVGQSVSSYANYEQLVGGVETLFKDSAGIVQQNANKAFETAGLSANDYMETVTGFSASLLQSVGNDTAKAANMANTALVDMSDNANKMGTSMESIQNAYQGFAKQNYTMLDNLKLGYGGTKEEMERLLKDATKLTGQKYDVSSFADITEAIHAIQTEMKISGLTEAEAAKLVAEGVMTEQEAFEALGTTAKEAKTTIQGSLNAMKSAWSNTLVALVTGGDNLDSCIDSLKSTALTFAGNIMPAIESALGGVGSLIEGIAPMLEKEFPKLVDTLLPPLINATLSLVKGLIKALPNILKVLIDQLPNIVRQLGEAFVEAFGIKIPLLERFGNFFIQNANAIAKSIPYLLGFVGVLVMVKSVLSKLNAVSGLFGNSSKNDAVSGMLSPFQSLAKAKPTTILKGIANLAIIIGGITVLAVGLMALAPYIAKLTDIKSIMKLIAVIGVLGLVGSTLAVLAGLVGNIPVSSVALGLANISIIVAGMSALFLLIGATSLINFDLNRIMQIVKIIAVLGTVGAALSLFAGIVGMIPIPVVLLGLANIALVLGGLSAIIIAFGALSDIPGFDEFISKGGETLANLFNVIGKIAGSFVGGIGEGVTNSLPKIGENLSAFAEALKPLISTFNGADISSIGSFFSAIGSFMLTMAGNDILSFFTGGPDFVGIGKELSAFAESAEGFFTKVAGFPENSFSNAAALFQSLADIGNVPNTGGIAQWFSGTNDFNALAVGLQQLSSDGVIGFFEKVAALPTGGFDNAKSLFQSLADIGNIPNTGGVAQWFSGTNDFSGLTEKLPAFGEAMASFYNSISAISDFDKISQLFGALHGIGEAFPNTGGIAQWFTGQNDISGVGSKLKQFGIDTKDFFKQVTSLNIGNLNGLWESVKKAGEVAATDLSNLAGKGTELTNFMNNAKGFFTGAGEVVTQLEAVNSVATALQNFFAIVAGIVDTSLMNINEGLNITVALIQSSTNDFTMFGMAIVVASTTGATAFLYFQTTATTSLETLRMSTTTVRMAISIEFERLARSIKSKCTEVTAVVNNTANRIKSAFNGINLSGTGTNIMNGLINGVRSKEGELLGSLNSLATKITGTLNSALEIHSPSRITYKIGAFLAQGGIKGILDNIPKAERASEELATAYTPNSYKTFNNRNSHTEYNTYSPQFNLTISGGDDDRRLRQKVKQWVKEGMNEVFDSMSRRTEPIQET